jgi:hypothetical protein
MVMAKLESPLGEEWAGRIKIICPPPEGIYVARTLVRESREVPVRVMNVNRREAKFRKGSPLAQCEPVTLVPLTDKGQPQARNANSRLQDVTKAA